MHQAGGVTDQDGAAPEKTIAEMRAVCFSSGKFLCKLAPEPVLDEQGHDEKHGNTEEIVV